MASSRPTDNLDTISSLLEEAKTALHTRNPSRAKELELHFNEELLGKIYFGLSIGLFTLTTLSHLSNDKIKELIPILLPDKIFTAQYQLISTGATLLLDKPIHERLQLGLSTADYERTLIGLAKRSFTVTELEQLNLEKIGQFLASKLAEDPPSPLMAAGAELIRNQPALNNFLKIALSPLEYEKTLIGLAKKLFTVETLSALQASEIQKLLREKKLLRTSLIYPFSGRDISASQARPEKNTNWARFYQDQLLSPKELHQKILASKLESGKKTEEALSQQTTQSLACK